MSEYDEYKSMFLEELKEIIKQLNEMLIKLEKNPNDKDSLYEVMRAAHTIKGMAATMGYESLTTLSHAVEDILLEIMKQETFNKAIIEHLFRFADLLEEYKERLEKNKSITDIQYKDVIASLEAVAKGEELLEEEEEIALKLGEKYQVIVSFSKDTKLKAARAMIVIRNLEAIANILSTKPDIEAIEEGEYFDKLEIELITNETIDKLEAAVKNVQDVTKVEIVQLMEEVEEAPVVQKEQKIAGIVTRAESIQTIRVKLSQLDYVLDLLGELLQANAKISDRMGGKFDPIISEQVSIIERNVVDLQNEVMKMRMVTLTHILDRIPRMVRDIAAQENKQVNVIIRGSHLELDRSVIDQLNEAILHLVRNAIHHGIEDKKTRKKLKKPEYGQIIIEAKQERSEIVVVIEDDGAGINFEKVRQRAVELGLIRPDQRVSKSELLDFLFYEGFSTKEKADKVGGRGVGLDIVERVISEINGSIQVETVENKGTKFILRVPQTVAIISALIIRSENQLFALPLSNVEQIYKENELNVFEQEGLEYATIDEELVPVIDLDQIVAEYYGTPLTLKSNKKAKLIFWYKGGQQVLMRIRNLVGQREIVTKQITAYFQDFPGITGATTIGEEIALIIDPLGMLELMTREIV